MNLYRIAGTVAMTAAASTAAAAQNIPLEYYKVSIEIIGGLFVIAKAVKVLWKWHNGAIHHAVDESIQKHLKNLACVRTGGLFCDGSNLTPDDKRWMEDKWPGSTNSERDD